MLSESLPGPVPTRRYRQAILCEDLLTGAECLSFATELQEGRARIGDIDLQRGQDPQRTTELLPVNNDAMASAG
jgi:hypothetical protein